LTATTTTLFAANTKTGLGVHFAAAGLDPQGTKTNKGLTIHDYNKLDAAVPRPRYQIVRNVAPWEIELKGAAGKPENPCVGGVEATEPVVTGDVSGVAAADAVKWEAAPDPEGWSKSDELAYNENSKRERAGPDFAAAAAEPEAEEAEAEAEALAEAEAAPVEAAPLSPPASPEPDAFVAAPIAEPEVTAAEDPFGAAEAEDPFAAAAVSEPVVSAGEENALIEWAKANRAAMEAKDAANSAKRAAVKEKAEEELEDFYSARTNTMAGRAESNRAAEEAFTSAVLGERSDSAWSNVLMFMDTKQTGEGVDLARMRNVLIQCKDPHYLEKRTEV